MPRKTKHVRVDGSTTIYRITGRYKRPYSSWRAYVEAGKPQVEIVSQRSLGHYKLGADIRARWSTPIQLSEVLFPLRFDVWDQVSDVKRFGDMRKAGETCLLDLGLDSSIHRQPRIANQVYTDIGFLREVSDVDFQYRIERYYGSRMEKLTSYYVSIDNGWDERQDKILFHHVLNPTVTTSGHPVPEGLFLTNGQHRTTALLALGYTELPDTIAEINDVDGKDFLPLDLTSAYIKAGACSEEDFVHFARFRFPGIPETIVNVLSLSAWMKACGPQWAIDYLAIYWSV